MRAVGLAALAVAALSPCFALNTSGTPYVGAYLLIDDEGVAKLNALAGAAATLPINRLWISFFSPSLVYVPGSNTLKYSGLGLQQDGDFGFSVLKTAISALEAGGVEVMLSMGGWNDNCWPYTYTYYSIGQYNPSPNYYKIQEYSTNGQLSGCVEANLWCYTCEPPSQNTTYGDYGMFPEPAKSATWQQAVAYITANAGGPPPLFNGSLIPNTKWTDPKTGLTVLVPGEDLWYTEGRDPYQDIVYLAKDLGASGIDVDYEEFWHADYNRLGMGPWTLPQTVYKYSSILKDIQINILAIEPTLKLSTAAPAVGSWSGNWWGGNLKGLVYYANEWFPSVISFVSTGANAGGVNVMTYDLSDDEQFFECPQPSVCPLNQQVNFYMGTYTQAGIPAGIGYETGTPAYPDPTKYPTFQLPLTSSELALILQNTQPQFSGAFFWELFKQPAQSDEVSPTQLAQQLCNLLLPGQARCAGSIPSVAAA